MVQGIEEVAGTNAAHGEAGVAYVEGAKKKLGLTQPWEVSKDTYKFFEGVQKKNEQKHNAWKVRDDAERLR